MILFSITDWFSSISWLEQVFLVIGISSTLLFVVQVMLALIGFDGESEMDSNIEGIDPSFSLISFRTILAFLVCFGWIGFYSLSTGSSTISALVWASLSGISAMVIVAYLLFILIKMNESGTVNLEEAIGSDGEVYITIPKKGDGMGRVSILIGDRLMELNAISEADQISSGVKVRVTGTKDGDILVVSNIN